MHAQNEEPAATSIYDVLIEDASKPIAGVWEKLTSFLLTLVKEIALVCSYVAPAINR